MPSLTSERVVVILQHFIAREPLYCKNQQKTGFFNRISVVFDPKNTSHISRFAKKMDTESYRQIRGQKISNAILWALVFTPFAEQCHFPYSEVKSYFKAKM